ncbi:hypothetical protein CLF_111950 [Clonorchis sinensis]|uniref:Uncharacterized protein n=1 Tax=Clonorchis sinensis TaxID=79923 RepID=G7YVL0_CLOSI|nr:hypothetical protein CLF_111950 [Clonorchis sinensis]
MYRKMRFRVRILARLGRWLCEKNSFRNSANLYAEHVMTKPAQPMGCYQFIFDVPQHYRSGIGIIRGRLMVLNLSPDRESGMKLMDTVRMAVMKMYEKGKSRFMAYMQRDNLGEKIAAVLEICKYFSVHQRFMLDSDGTFNEAYRRLHG